MAHGWRDPSLYARCRGDLPPLGALFSSYFIDLELSEASSTRCRGSTVTF